MDVSRMHQGHIQNKGSYTTDYSYKIMTQLRKDSLYQSIGQLENVVSIHKFIPGMS
jgi:hypothetical protein